MVDSYRMDDSSSKHHAKSEKNMRILFSQLKPLEEVAPPNYNSGKQTIFKQDSLNLEL